MLRSVVAGVGGIDEGAQAADVGHELADELVDEAARRRAGSRASSGRPRPCRRRRPGATSALLFGGTHLVLVVLAVEQVARPIHARPRSNRSPARRRRRRRRRRAAPSPRPRAARRDTTGPSAGSGRSTRRPSCCAGSPPSRRRGRRPSRRGSSRTRRPCGPAARGAAGAPSSPGELPVAVHLHDAAHLAVGGGLAELLRRARAAGPRGSSSGPRRSVAWPNSTSRIDRARARRTGTASPARSSRRGCTSRGSSRRCRAQPSQP